GRRRRYGAGVRRFGIGRADGAQQGVTWLRVDFQAGRLNEIPHRRIRFGAPNAVGRTIVESLAGEFALDAGDELEPRLSAGVSGRGRLPAFATAADSRLLWR